jgi:hypothetical protein
MLMLSFSIGRTRSASRGEYCVWTTEPANRSNGCGTSSMSSASPVTTTPARCRWLRSTLANQNVGLPTATLSVTG